MDVVVWNGQDAAGDVEGGVPVLLDAVTSRRVEEFARALPVGGSLSMHRTRAGALRAVAGPELQVPAEDDGGWIVSVPAVRPG